MVFYPDTTTEEQSTTTSDSITSLSLLDTLERVSTMITPAVQLLTVIVQALTAYTLVRQV
jgi:hypothetical protein